MDGTMTQFPQISRRIRYPILENLQSAQMYNPIGSYITIDYNGQNEKVECLTVHAGRTTLFEVFEVSSREVSEISEEILEFNQNPEENWLSLMLEIFGTELSQLEAAITRFKKERKDLRKIYKQVGERHEQLILSKLAPEPEK